MFEVTVLNQHSILGSVSSGYVSASPVPTEFTDTLKLLNSISGAKSGKVHSCIRQEHEAAQFKKEAQAQTSQLGAEFLTKSTSDVYFSIFVRHSGSKTQFVRTDYVDLFVH